MNSKSKKKNKKRKLGETTPNKRFNRKKRISQLSNTENIKESLYNSTNNFQNIPHLNNFLSNTTTNDFYRDAKNPTSSNMIITIPNIDMCFLSNDDDDSNNEKVKSQNLEKKDSTDINLINSGNSIKVKKRHKTNYNKEFIDDFMIYEIKGKEDSEKNEFELIIEKEEKAILEDSRLYSYLIRVADSVEKYYFNCINTEAEQAEKYCFFCNSQNVPVDSLLQFTSFEQFLAYLKFTMIFRRNLLLVNEKKFTRNLIEVFDFIDYYDEKLKKKIYFKNTKYSCKFCILSILNKTNLLFRVLRILKLSDAAYDNFKEKDSLDANEFYISQNKNSDCKKISTNLNIKNEEGYHFILYPFIYIFYR